MRHATTAFDGEGARRYGARWNSPGVRVAYASESASLAVLEVLAHLGTSSTLPSYALVSADIPEALVEDLDIAQLPSDWRVSPPPARVQALGDAWVRARASAVLRVPTVLVPSEHNLLINPAHPDAARVRVGVPERFAFDPRLVARP